MPVSSGNGLAAHGFDQLVAEEAVDDAIDIQRLIVGILDQIAERTAAVDEEEDPPLIERERDFLGVGIRDDAEDDGAVGKQALAFFPLGDAPRAFHDQVREIDGDRDGVRRDGRCRR